MTSFRFGGRSVPGQHASTPGRVHGILPPNAGIAHSAQDRVDALTSAAARRFGEAISGVDAVQLFIFQPLKHGPLCNCGNQPSVKTKVETNPNPHVLGIKESTDHDALDGTSGPLNVRVADVTAYDYHQAHASPNEPDHRFSEEDILGGEAVPPVSSTSGTTNPYTSEDSLLNDGPYEGPTHGNGGLYLHKGSYDHERPDSDEDVFGEELLAEFEKEGWNPDSVLMDNAYVLGSFNTCPICFNSGVLGGYGLLGATRLVLSSVNAVVEPLLRADDSVQPPVYHLQKNEYVEWSQLQCPNYFTFGWAAAYNMRKKAVELTVTYSLDGTTYYPIAQIGQHSQVALSGLRIRVANLTDYEVDFTHLDLTLIHNVFKGQVTNFNRTASRASAIKGDGIEITLPPEAGRIDANSLIAEVKYQLMWRVMTVTPIETAQGQVISCTASTEVMEPSLVETVLFPYYNVQGNRQLIFGAGVEPVQGMR